MHLKTLVAAMSVGLVLAACGGGNSGSSGGGASTLTGTLADSYVKGVTYTAAPSGKAGTTGPNGEFSYMAGDMVTFKLGSVTLGSVNMSSPALGSDGSNVMVRPKDLAGVTDETDEKALAVAQLLQTAAGALPGDTRIDVSGNAAKFTTADTVDSLDKVGTLIGAAGLTPVAMEKVTEHLLNAPASVKSVEFTPTDVTGLTDANRAIAYTTSTIKVAYADGSSKTFPLSYVNLFNNTDTNKTADGSAAAAIHDRNGVIIKDANNKPFVPQTPDANSLMDIDGALYLVTHFEYENKDSAGNDWYGKVPMTMTLSKLSQNSGDGKLTVDSIKQIDFSGVNGLWIPCAGSRSPWNTHLGSEEYEPDARCETDAAYAAVAGGNCLAMEYTARMNAFRVLYGDATASPYNYGRVPEVTIAMDGSSTVQKWYTLGRLSREKVQFFGDSRTAIQGDDGTYTSLTMFVADKAKDLSAGTLYAAKWNQLSPDGTDGGKATLSWIKLGHATNAEIRAAVDAGVKFSDLFDVDTTGGATPVAGFTRVKHGHEVATVEDLKLKAGTFAGVNIDTLAAFLETRRYAALKGATVEFEKFEGVAYNARDNKAYAAMTRMTNGMENKSGDPVNDIRLKKNSSGAVYQLSLQPGWFDSTGDAIHSRFVPVVMEALVVGEDMATDADGNKSRLDKIASPDNVAFSERMRVLFIGEDSSNHVNNYLWAFHVDTGKLVRILSLPMGAESTGLQAVDNLNGHAYIMSNYQHAGDKNSTLDPTYSRILPLINPDKAEVGYLGGLPAMR
jgi:secreted PhoX family phosphatase